MFKYIIVMSNCNVKNNSVHMFVFVEKLASFWNLFESRISSDPTLPMTVINLFQARLISYDKLIIIMKLSAGPFVNNVIFKLVRAEVSAGTNNKTENFKFFLLQNKHYNILHKQWKEVG